MIGAVDIGGTKIAVGMVNSEGQVLSRKDFPTDTDNYENGLATIRRLLGGTSQAAGVQITGIGIGSTGPVDPFAGTFGDVDFLPGWRGKNLVQDLARHFRVPVALENDADAAAMAEAGWGAGKNKTRLIYVTVGTGIGGGIVFDGKLYRGVDGSHPEIGHQVIDPAGPQCSCGFRGCWESLAAGPAMAAWFVANSSGDNPPSSGVTAKEICDQARQGNSLAKQAVVREAHYLGLGIANLINLFAPEVIVLSGSVMKSAELFLDEMNGVIAGGCRFVPFEKTRIVLASLGEHANLIGAARAWHDGVRHEAQATS